MHQSNPAHPAATNPATAFSIVSCWKIPEAAALLVAGAFPVAVPVAAPVAVPVPALVPAPVPDGLLLGGVAVPEAAEPEDDGEDDDSDSTLSVRTPPDTAPGFTVLAFFAAFL